MTDYPRPSLTADIVVLSLDEHDALTVLMIRRGRAPFQGAWALPGGFCEPNETIAKAAQRELEEETHVTGLEVEELCTFSTPGRDPRGWVVSVAHLAALPRARRAEAKSGDDAEDARWLRFSLNPVALADGAPLALSELAFDHRDILAAAAKRLLADRERWARALSPEDPARGLAALEKQGL